MIQKTTSERVWDMIGLSIYVGSIILLLVVWSSLPSEVPAHYNFLGEVDRWGKKWELLILPVVGGFLLLMMQALEKHPEAHNYPKRLNESNAEAFYLNSRKMLNQLKNSSLIVLSAILIESISIAMDWINGFGKWFIPILLIGVFLPMLIGLLKQRKIR
ncbi:DUF1648 domain-containing protein [Ornithinibacillus scapharcae]|uniref:DUF1648 domain-containing protein n=1 Tax=Ornithinibacillus scapharcae TaxID=1147159 RepID=UPI000527FC14|nr:DUF1648 domain-containing protein [Ornithinibacillus scapharcae]